MHVAIIGNGVAGITTARYLRKATDWQITVISAETKHHFSRTALMYIYMGHMKYEHTKPYEDHFWAKNDITLVHDFVERVDTTQNRLLLREEPAIAYDKLVIATGSKPNRFGWPGQDLAGVQGLYSYQDLQLMEENTADIDRGVVVGGGLIGIEVAEMLHSRGINVTLLVREKNYWSNALPTEEAQMVNEVINAHDGIDLRLQTNLNAITEGPNGRAAGVVTEAGEEISCQFVALTPGVHPNIDLVEDHDIATDTGILVNHCFETNHPDIYAAGDCAEFTDAEEGDPAIEQLWYTGRMHGEALARILCGNRQPYERGIWFNSAKFFNMEWQTYGRVPNQLPKGITTFWWQHEEGRPGLRINFRAQNRAITGINAMGMRLRHKVCEQWIEEQKSLEHMLQHLGEVMFDPEFSERHEQAIIAHYNRTFPDQPTLSLNRKRGLFGLFQFKNTQTA